MVINTQLQCYQWGEVCKLGLQEEKLTKLPTPSEEDVAIICYTSGKYKLVHSGTGHIDINLTNQHDADD